MATYSAKTLRFSEPGQKDMLTFSTLARQIEGGLGNNYPELEIVDAVICAIPPVPQLRSYIESKGELPLPQEINVSEKTPLVREFKRCIMSSYLNKQKKSSRTVGHRFTSLCFR